MKKQICCLDLINTFIFTTNLFLIISSFWCLEETFTHLYMELVGVAILPDIIFTKRTQEP